MKAQDIPVKWATQETFFEGLEGKRLPDFKGITVTKMPFNNAELKNQVVLINFWFEKCPPCIAEMPELNALVKKYKDSGIRFIGITHDAPKAAQNFQKRNGYLYEIVCLSQEEIQKLNINHGFPTNVLVGKNGKILYAMANVSFSNDYPEFKHKSLILEEKLKVEILSHKQ